MTNISSVKPNQTYQTKEVKAAKKEKICAKLKNNASNVAETTVLIGGAGTAYNLIQSKMRFGLYDWNTKMNEPFKALLQKIEKQVTAAKNPVWGTGKNIDWKKFVTTAEGKADLVAQFGKIKGRLINLGVNAGLKIMQCTKQVCETVAKSSGRQKALFALAIGTIALFTAIQKKHSHKSGEIDQKYADTMQQIKTKKAQE